MIPSAAMGLGFWGMHAGRPREVELSGKTKRGRKEPDHATRVTKLSAALVSFDQAL